MKRTWRWLLAIDSSALTLLALDRATRGETLASLEIDLPVLAPGRSEATEFVDHLKMRLSEIDSIGCSGVWWEKRGWTRGSENGQVVASSSATGASPMDGLRCPSCGDSRVK